MFKFGDKYSERANDDLVTFVIIVRIPVVYVIVGDLEPEFGGF
jgi:hypothetical protein